jgi:L-iditol 2-dehydrogenase
MLALAKVGPGADRLALLERARPSPAPHEVVIEVAVAGVCGSDLHLQRGTLTLVERRYPLWLGHEYAGTVVAAGRDVDHAWLGTRVTAEPSAGCGCCADCTDGHANLCRARRFDGGGFAARVAVPVSRVHALPEEVPFEVGALCEPLACVVHGLVEVARISPGDVCVVIGPGPVGLLTALVAQAHGARTVVVGRATSRARLHLARSLGLSGVIELRSEDPHEHVRTLTRGRGADLVVGCAGGAGALALGLELIRARGAYLELALGSPPALVDPDAIAGREVRLTGSIGHTPAAWRRVLAMLGAGVLPVAPLARLATADFPLHDWARAFAAAADRTEGKVLIRPESAAP